MDYILKQHELNYTLDENKIFDNNIELAQTQSDKESYLSQKQATNFVYKELLSIAQTMIYTYFKEVHSNKDNIDDVLVRLKDHFKTVPVDFCKYSGSRGRYLTEEKKIEINTSVMGENFFDNKQNILDFYTLSLNVLIHEYAHSISYLLSADAPDSRQKEEGFAVTLTDIILNYYYEKGYDIPHVSEHINSYEQLPCQSSYINESTLFRTLLLCAEDNAEDLVYTYGLESHDKFNEAIKNIIGEKYSPLMDLQEIKHAVAQDNYCCKLETSILENLFKAHYMENFPNKLDDILLRRIRLPKQLFNKCLSEQSIDLSSPNFDIDEARKYLQVCSTILKDTYDLNVEKGNLQNSLQEYFYKFWDKNLNKEWIEFDDVTNTNKIDKFIDYSTQILEGSILSEKRAIYNFVYIPAFEKLISHNENIPLNLASCDIYTKFSYKDATQTYIKNNLFNNKYSSFEEYSNAAQKIFLHDSKNRPSKMPNDFLINYVKYSVLGDKKPISANSEDIDNLVQVNNSMSKYLTKHNIPENAHKSLFQDLLIETISLEDKDLKTLQCPDKIWSVMKHLNINNLIFKNEKINFQLALLSEERRLDNVNYFGDTKALHNILDLGQIIGEVNDEEITRSLNSLYSKGIDTYIGLIQSGEHDKDLDMAFKAAVINLPSKNQSNNVEYNNEKIQTLISSIISREMQIILENHNDLQSKFQSITCKPLKKYEFIKDNIANHGIDCSIINRTVKENITTFVEKMSKDEKLSVNSCLTLENIISNKKEINESKNTSTSVHTTTYNHSDFKNR